MDGDGLAIVGLAASIGVGLVFFLTGVGKLRHAALMTNVVANYRLLPLALVAPVARALPFVELVVAGGLLAGLRSWPQWLAIAMLLTFAAAMAVNIRRGRAHIDCGCGLSALRRPLDRATVIRNSVLAAALLPATVADGVEGWPETAVAVAGGAAVLLFYMVFHAIAAVPRGASATIGR